MLPEGGSRYHASMTITASTRLPILEGCLLTIVSVMSNGQSGIHQYTPLASSTVWAQDGGTTIPAEDHHVVVLWSRQSARTPAKLQGTRCTRTYGPRSAQPGYMPLTRSTPGLGTIGAAEERRHWRRTRGRRSYKLHTAEVCTGGGPGRRAEAPVEDLGQQTWREPAGGVMSRLW